jgi:hypothetical protein
MLWAKAVEERLAPVHRVEAFGLLPGHGDPLHSDDARAFFSIFARIFPAMFLLQASGLMMAKVRSIDKALLRAMMNVKSDFKAAGMNCQQETCCGGLRILPCRWRFVSGEGKAVKGAGSSIRASTTDMTLYRREENQALLASE